MIYTLIIQVQEIIKFTNVKLRVKTSTENQSKQQKIPLQGAGEY